MRCIPVSPVSIDIELSTDILQILKAALAANCLDKMARVFETPRI